MSQQLNNFQIPDDVTTHSSGSNADGSWVKYSDGTMICTTVESGIITTTDLISPIYNSPTVWFTWPEPFIETPRHLFASVRYGGSGRTWAGLLEAGSATQGGMRVYGINSTSNGRVTMTAIGRWKL